MNNPFTKEEYYSIDFGAFDAFIEAQYGHEYEVAAVLETSNDTSHTFNNIRKEPMDQWDQKALEAFKESGKQPSVYVLLKDLVNRDVLPEGNYLIDVSW